MSDQDQEKNRLMARARRYARVGANMSGVAARMAGTKLFGAGNAADSNAIALARALGGLKGPMMKVAQLLSTVPDMLPPEYAAQLAKLQSQAPPMGWAFVKRRMIAELGAGWAQRFASFEHAPAAAASLGQVHRATAGDGTALACKLQYADMQSAVAADLAQLKVLFALHRRLYPVFDTSEVYQEISERVREELDYRREAQHTALYRNVFAALAIENIRVPRVWPELSTGRLLTMDWLEGEPILSFKAADAATRNHLASAMFAAWWQPYAHIGIIHGDPHLGNYTVFRDNGRPAGINLLDFGCVRIFPTRFIGGVVDLYRGLLHADEARIFHAYESWGFRNLSKDLIETLNLWARFIFGPLLDDRVRTIADGVAPGEYGRREAFHVHQALKQKGPVTVPREFVFMDRAAIGLGSVFLHLDAELNFHRLFEEAISDFSADTVGERQRQALAEVGLSYQPS